MRSMVEGACGDEASGDAVAPSTALRAVTLSRFAGQDKHGARRETRVCIVGRQQSGIVLLVCRD